MRNTLADQATELLNASAAAAVLSDHHGGLATAASAEHARELELLAAPSR